MTHFNTERTKCPDVARVVAEYPEASQKMSIEEMIVGFTINGAKQLGIEAAKGSIAAGKDADFLVFNNDLLAAGTPGSATTSRGTSISPEKKLN